MHSPQEEIEALLNYRPRTDYKISGKWLLAPVGNYLLMGAILLVLFLELSGQLPADVFEVVLATLATMTLVAFAATAYLVYLLVNRRNVHFAREQAMFGSVVEILRGKVRPDDANAQASLASNYQCYYWLSERSGERSAILEALLSPVGWVLMMFELLFLGEDWKEHEKREDYMIQEVNRTLSFLGYYVLPTRLRPSQVRLRDSAVWLVLTLFTLGIAELVWFYNAVEDPLEHFEFHSHLEFPMAGLSAPPKTSPGAAA